MKNKKMIIGGIVVLAVGVGAFVWYNKKKKKELAAKKPATPATTPTKTAGADGDDDEDSNFAASMPRFGTTYRPSVPPVSAVYHPPVWYSDKQKQIRAGLRTS